MLEGKKPLNSRNEGMTVVQRASPIPKCPKLAIRTLKHQPNHDFLCSASRGCSFLPGPTESKHEEPWRMPPVPLDLLISNNLSPSLQFCPLISSLSWPTQPLPTSASHKCYPFHTATISQRPLSIQLLIPSSFTRPMVWCIHTGSYAYVCTLQELLPSPGRHPRAVPAASIS